MCIEWTSVLLMFPVRLHKLPNSIIHVISQNTQQARYDDPLLLIIWASYIMWTVVRSYYNPPPPPGSCLLLTTSREWTEWTSGGTCDL